MLAFKKHFQINIALSWTVNQSNQAFYVKNESGFESLI